MKFSLFFLSFLTILSIFYCSSETEKATQSSGIEQSTPQWEKIKQNATFIIPDTSYSKPYIQELNVGGWEDGLYITRDSTLLFAFYMPVDVFSLVEAWEKQWQENPGSCFDYLPYSRGPLLGVDMITNPWGCKNFFQSDIIISEKNYTDSSFKEWQSSNLQKSVSQEGAPCAVIKDSSTFDVFVFTQTRVERGDLDIMFMHDVSRNPSGETAVPIVSSTASEDNPHIERLSDGSLLLFFDRERYIYYTKSYDNGEHWEEAKKITQVLNDNAPYDIQPHLWNDGKDWWVYFCADNENGRRSIYKSKQLIKNDWDSWGEKEPVIAPDKIEGDYGVIAGVGEPTLTDKGDISFLVIYGDLNSEDKTDVYDSDPWFLAKK